VRKPGVDLRRGRKPGDDGKGVNDRLYWRPIARRPEDASARARPLAGGPLVFSEVELIRRREPRRIVGISDLSPSLLTPFIASRPPLVGLDWSRPRVVGVLNVTPDSFSDGGDFASADAAIDHGRALGADILDIGAESTRPGALEVPGEEELRRLLPVIEALARTAPVSVDTRKAAVMRAAVAAGARLVNDVSALTHDPDALEAARGAEAVVLMHSPGPPETMQSLARYDDVLLDVYDALDARIAACEAAGLPREKLIADPGIGFGKTGEHNLALLRGLGLFHGLGVPVLVGLSRKSFIGRLSVGEPPKGRLPGSLAGALWAASQGVQLLRVHDVAETRQALALWTALRGGDIAFPIP
jgi:dihydropteroate synthase